MRWSKGLNVACLLTLSGLLCTAMAGDAVVSVIHGVPGLDLDQDGIPEEFVVDVCLDANGDGLSDTVLVTGFAFGEIFTTELSEGVYDLAVSLPGSPAGEPCRLPLFAAELPVTPDANVSVVAHRTQDGRGATVTTFQNDTSRLRIGGALVARHLAAAPTVDLGYGRIILSRRFSGLGYGTEQSAQVFSGRWRVQVTLPGQRAALLGPSAVRLPGRSSTVVYVVGSVAEGGLSFVVQSIDRRR